MLMYFSAEEDVISIFGGSAGNDNMHGDSLIILHEGKSYRNLSYEKLKEANQGTIFIDTNTGIAEILKPGDQRLKGKLLTPEK